MNLVSLLLLIMGALPAKTLRIDLATDARVVRYANAATPRDGEALVRPLAVATCDLDLLLVRGIAPAEEPFPW